MNITNINIITNIIANQAKNPHIKAATISDKSTSLNVRHRNDKISIKAKIKQIM